MTIKKWLVIGITFAITGFVCSVLSDLNLGDESWFLQVAHRVGHGEVLYRDIFCGVTPLSVYLTVLFTTCFGTEILVLKALNALLFASTVLLCCCSLHRLNTQRATWNLGLALCLLYPSGVVGGCGSVYNPLANLFFIACFACILLPRSTAIKFTTAAACAALCFGSKQNMGLIALFAVTLVARVHQVKKMWLGIWGVFAGISTLILLPVYFSGGRESFLDYAFLNKTTYIHKGHIAYFTQAHFGVFPDNLLFALPLIVIGALTYIWWKDRGVQRAFTVTLLIFCVGSFLAIFPRADKPHLMIAMPMTLVGLLYAGGRMIPKFPWNTKVIAILIGFFILRIPYTEVRGLIQGKRVMLTLEHFHGGCVNMHVHQMIKMRLEALKSQIPEKCPIFFLSPFAGFYYLALDLANPTPFDYPFVTAFGKDGESQVISQLTQGMIQSVIVDDALHAELYLQPTQLCHYVYQEMHRTVERAPGFQVYRQ